MAYLLFLFLYLNTHHHYRSELDLTDSLAHKMRPAKVYTLHWKTNVKYRLIALVAKLVTLAHA